MEWVERRAGLIGIGALVVAAVALGVAIADNGSRSDHRLVGYVDHFGGPAPFDGGAPFQGGPVPRRFDAGPQQLAPGTGPSFRRFDVRPGHALPVPGLAAGSALHGELTLPSAKGKFETVEIQRGKVTKVGNGQLTVRSADGFTETYAVPAALIRGVKTGDEVQLRATVSNGKATVTGLRAARQTMR